MNKSIIHKFDPVIYPYKIWVIVSKTPDIIAEKFNEYNGDIIEFSKRETRNLQAFVFPVQDKEQTSFGVIIFFRSKLSMTYRTVSHESCHAAKYLFEHIGADITPHEPFEYVVDWIASCIEKVKLNKI